VSCRRALSITIYRRFTTENIQCVPKNPSLIWSAISHNNHNGIWDFLVHPVYDDNNATVYTTHTHTHTHIRLMALCPGLPGSAGTRKVNQSGFYWSKRQWVAVASARPYASLHIALDRTTPAPHHSVFTDRMPLLPPNQPRQSTEGTFILHCSYYRGTKTMTCRRTLKLTVNNDFNSTFIVSPFSIDFSSAVIYPIISSSNVLNAQSVHVLCISATCNTKS